MPQPKNQPLDPSPGMVKELLQKLTPEQKKLFESILNDPKRLNQVLNSPQAQELKKKFGPPNP